MNNQDIPMFTADQNRKMIQEGSFVRKRKVRKAKADQEQIFVAGQVIKKFPFFLLVRLSHTKTCLHYDDAVLIDQSEYNRLNRSGK